MNSRRAFVIPAVVWLLAALAGATQLIPDWRVTNIFKPKPPTAALVKAESDLAQAKKDAKAAQDALDLARKAENDRQMAQMRYAQQMALGAQESLSKAPPSPPVALAQSLLGRANPALVAAIGGLPAEQQTEIMAIVAQSLSGLTDELAKANATLAARDKELAVVTAERSTLQQQIPALESAVKTKDAIVVEQTGIVAKKTQEVLAFTDKLVQKEKEAGSLTGQVNNLGRILLLAGIGYLIIHFLVPSVAQEFPQVKLLQGANRTLTSFFSSHEIVDQTQPPKT